MRRVLLPTLLLALCLPGCAALKRLLADVVQAPTLHFEGAKVRDLSFTGAGVDLTWAIRNPNDFGLSLASLSYTFRVNGKRLAEGRTEKDLEIAPAGESRITLPFDVRYLEAANIVTKFYRKDEVGWRITGHFGFQTPAGVIEVPYDRKGTLPVPRLPGVHLARLRTESLSLAGAGIAVEVDLENPNRFPLPAPRLDWSLSLSGRPVGRGRATGGTLPAGGAQRLTLPVRVDFANSGRALYDGLRSGEIDVSLSGTLEVGPVSLPIDVRRTLKVR